MSVLQYTRNVIFSDIQNTQKPTVLFALKYYEKRACLIAPDFRARPGKIGRASYFSKLACYIALAPINITSAPKLA